MPSDTPHDTHRIEIAFETRDEAERAFDAIEKLLGDMGQIGTLFMTTVPTRADDDAERLSWIRTSLAERDLFDGRNWWQNAHVALLLRLFDSRDAALREAQQEVANLTHDIERALDGISGEAAEVDRLGAALREAREEAAEKEEARLRAVRVCKEQIVRATRHQFEADRLREEVERLREALEMLSDAVFGAQLGSEPDVYSDYDKLCEMQSQCRAALARPQPATPSPVLLDSSGFPVMGSPPSDAATDGGQPEAGRLFVDGEFTAHSGDTLPFKIDCDALTDADLATLAAEVARRLPRFRRVHGVSRGGLRFAEALHRYDTDSPLDPVLIVDDVLTTGASMEEARSRLGRDVIGAVIFARGPCPDWIMPLFTVPAAADSGTTVADAMREVARRFPDIREATLSRAGGAKASAEDVDRAKWLWDNLPLRKHENKQSWLDMTAAALSTRGAEGERAATKAARHTFAEFVERYASISEADRRIIAYHIRTMTLLPPAASERK